MHELFNAASHNDAHAVSVLIESGSDPLMKNDNGDTPAHVAARLGHVDVIAAMPIYALSGINEYGQRPLHVAAENGQAAVCRALLSMGLVSDGVDESGRTPLQLAQAGGHLETVHLLGARVAPAPHWQAVMAADQDARSAMPAGGSRSRGGPEL